MRHPLIPSHPTEPEEICDERATAAASLHALVQRKTKGRRSTRSISAREVSQIIAEAEEFAKTGDWSSASPRHLVGLYMICHMRVYKVPCDEIKGVVFSRVAMLAGKARMEMQSIGRVAGMILWAWRREEGRMVWRQNNPDPNRPPAMRLGWKYQLSPKMMTDYRVALAQNP